MLAAARLQLQLMRADRDYWLTFTFTPFFALIFLAIVRHAGREDLTAYAILAPILIAMWSTSLIVSGEIVDADRWLGVLEAVVAAPAPFALLVLGRILAVTCIALLSIAETLVVARVGFRVAVHINHWDVLVLTLLVTVIAMAATATIMAALFVLARTARTFQISLSYPFYVLGGVLVPVSILPDWIRPLSRLVFLSWSSDLLRDSLQSGTVRHLGVRLGAILALAVVGFLIGWRCLAVILDRVRGRGSLSLT
jgi:ABC-2 type transport system permease protein